MRNILLWEKKKSTKLFIASSFVAYVDIHAAFSRRRREGNFTQEEYETIKNEFQRDWENMMQSEILSSTISLIKINRVQPHK